MLGIWIAAAVLSALGSMPDARAEGSSCSLQARQGRGAETFDPVLRALEAFEAGKLERVLELAEEMPPEAEQRPRMDYLVGEVLYLQGDLTGAEQAFRRVVERRTEAAPAWIGLGRTLLRRGIHAEAEGALRRALELSPDDPRALASLALVLAARLEMDEALALARKAQRADRDDTEVVRALVLVLLHAKDEKEAEKVATRLSRSSRRHPMGPFLLGLVHERQGKDSLAIREYQEALSRDERFLDAHKNLAILCHTLSNTYQDGGRVDLAFRHYERYFELGGKDPELQEAYNVMKRVLRPEAEGKGG